MATLRKLVYMVVNGEKVKSTSNSLHHVCIQNWVSLHKACIPHGNGVFSKHGSMYKTKCQLYKQEFFNWDASARAVIRRKSGHECSLQSLQLVNQASPLKRAQNGYTFRLYEYIKSRMEQRL